MGQLGVKSSRNLIGWTAKIATSHVKVLSWEYSQEATMASLCGLRQRVTIGSIHCEHFKDVEAKLQA